MVFCVLELYASLGSNNAKHISVYVSMNTKFKNINEMLNTTDDILGVIGFGLNMEYRGDLGNYQSVLNI